MSDLTDEQLLRYARNILLPNVDIEGQETLLSSHVAIIGAGGLGSPVIQYLASAGVGELTIIDDDVVEETNLQRQVIHNLSQVGQQKVTSAAKFINNINPDVKVNSKSLRLDQHNVEELLNTAHIVVIGTDNFASRYVVNDYCRRNKIPLVTGAAIGLNGQVTSFSYRGDNAPCFSCIYPQGEDDQLSCATAGVLGPVETRAGESSTLPNER